MTLETDARGVTVCRGCARRDLHPVLDLGSQPLSNEMGRSADDVLPMFPLHLHICRHCGLGQVGEVVSPERLFADDYPYLSSTSASWLEHARTYAEDRVRDLALGPQDVVVEVASNDGYLLAAFQQHRIEVLGVEPAKNVAEIALEAGVPTVCRFFGAESAADIVNQVGHPRLIVANNVMAHVPDLQDFTAGLAVLADEHTIITVENPSLLTLLLERQFDTIYHEHFSYLTAHAVSQVVGLHGLELVRVDELPTHGGSNRYWLARAGAQPVDDSVARLLGQERSGGLFDPSLWEQFADESRAAVDGLRSWLDAQHAAGRRVVGYGAAAKGNTLLNAAAGTPDDLAYVVDASSAKQGRYLPGSAIAVRTPDELASGSPDDVLVLPWNLAPEIQALVLTQVPEAAVWVAVPRMTRLA